MDKGGTELRGYAPIGMLEEWNVGRMECWKNGSWENVVVGLMVKFLLITN